MSYVINGCRTDSYVFILELSHGALVDLVALVIGAQNPQGLTDRNMPLIFSRVPCLTLRSVQNGNNEVLFSIFSPLWIIHVYISCINEVVRAALLVCCGACDGFVMKESKLGVPVHLL